MFALAFLDLRSGIGTLLGFGIADVRRAELAIHLEENLTVASICDITDSQDFEVKDFSLLNFNL